jgi:hypothetical protein
MDDEDECGLVSRTSKEDLYPGCPVFYRPDVDNLHFDPSAGDEVPWGSMGIFLSLGSGWENFVDGFEPIDVLFGAAGRIIRVYMDEIELVK